MSDNRELAYRYDLFISPDWRERFDSILEENIEVPGKGDILEVNCGTGAYAIELAERMKGKGQVLGVDSSPERIEIARAKAMVKKVSDVKFQEADAGSLAFDSNRFDLVIGDASLTPANQIERVSSELLRVTRPGGRVILKLITRGSFDEFFSIYWEALNALGLVEDVWPELERMINERATISDVNSMMESLGLREVEVFSNKEEFFFETGSDFITNPLIEDMFLGKWLSIVPDERHNEVRNLIISLIETERHDAPFDISIKATLVTGLK
ncbi:MAG TPA: class I SAM-dependent methyltransferase [Blastocatellia bacterium]|nr:class I SAM-dependent methyltransferase [Blastocatellia bacterium]